MTEEPDKTCREGEGEGAGREGPAQVVVLGTLGAGKTTLFRRLCGARTEDVNLPESSVALTRGCLRGRGAGDGHPMPVLVDTPGTATLFAQSQEEAVARDALLRLAPTAILVVADAKNMRRSLALAVHAAELGLPMVVAVNMEDEALRHGTEVDRQRLAELLGVDVVGTVAVEDRGTVELRRALREPRVPEALLELPREIEDLVMALGDILGGLPISPRGAALLLLAGDKTAEALVEERLGAEPLAAARAIAERGRRASALPLEVMVTDSLYECADALAREVVARRPRRRSFLDRFGLWAQHPVLGVLIAAGVIAAMYYWVGVLGATVVVDAVSTSLFDGLLLPLVDRAVEPIPWAIVRDAIVDRDFGLVPTGLFLAFGLVLPVLFFFYFFFELLQSSGYLPRLSVLLDRLLRLIGLNGRGVLPLVMGFSCVTMALITTRMLETRKERIIASLLLMLGLPCAPLLSVLLAVLADMPISASVTVFGIIALQILLAGALANRVVPGLAPDFVMVIPDMRLPALNDVLLLTVRRTYYFMREAVPFFLLASLVLFAADRIGALDLLERGARPVVHGLLGLPDEAVRVFIKTIIRRENGAAELDLLRGRFDNVQLVVTMLVMTFLTPCVNAALVLVKERGLRNAAIMLVGVSAYAVLVGSVVSHLCRLLGVTFT